MKKIQCQLKLSVIHPPRVGPMAGRHHHGHPVHGEGLAALADGKGIGENGLLAGRQPAAANALQHAEEHQQRQGLRQAAQHRADGKQHDAGHVEALAAHARVSQPEMGRMTALDTR